MSRESMITKSFHEFASHIGFRIFGERALFSGDGVVGLFRVVHAETVVVLGGEHEVLHPAIFGQLRPRFGVELRGIEGLVKSLTL